MSEAVTICFAIVCFSFAAVKGCQIANDPAVIKAEAEKYVAIKKAQCRGGRDRDREDQE